MSSPAFDCATLLPAPSLLDVIELRAWARAFLWAEGEIETIAEAVDVLHADAERDGLDPDIVQKILADAFEPYRASEP